MMTPLIPFLLLNLGASAGLLAFVLTRAKREKGYASVARCCLSLGFLSIFLGSLTLMLQILAIFIVSLACLCCSLSNKVFARAVVTAVPVCYLLTFVFVSWPLLNRLERQRQAIPFRSVSHRLSYERNRSPARQSAAIPVRPQLLQSLERTEGSSYVARSLRALHDRTADQFALMAGFGPIRAVGMVTFGVSISERPVPVLRLPDPPAVICPPDDHSNSAPVLPPSLQPDLPSSQILLDFHATSRRDFLSSDRMGYIRDRDHVAGFQPHAFSEIPSTFDTSKWQVTRLELIGILSHDQPVAYESRLLPDMSQLREFPSRPLNDFETQALAQLQTQEDLVVEKSLNRIRMVGSLRAGTNCMACHAVERGELLGAFSYDLDRIVPVPESAIYEDTGSSTRRVSVAKSRARSKRAESAGVESSSPTKNDE